jgi:hypothetical protein
VIAHDVSPAYRMHADFALRAFAHDTVASVPGIVLIRKRAHFREDFS